MFLKLADKVDIDGISDKFEKWLHRFINLSYISMIAEKTSVRLCCQCNSFSFDWLFLDTDEISDKYNNWPDRFINLRVTFPLFQHNSFSFDQIFLKHADKADMDEMSHDFKNLAR